VQGVLSPGPRRPASIIDAGQGDKPLKDLGFRCTKCGSRRTDGVVMGKGGIGCAAVAAPAGFDMATLLPRSAARIRCQAPALPGLFCLLQLPSPLATLLGLQARLCGGTLG
jgi:hypothetical protein